MANRPPILSTIPNDFEALGKELKLENNTIRYISRKFQTPRDAINAVRAYGIFGLPHNVNDSMLNLYENAIKKGFIFRDYYFGTALRKLAAILEPGAYLSVELPYSRLLHGETISEEAYSSLRPLSSRQIKQVLAIISKVCSNESRYELIVKYLHLAPNEHLMSGLGKASGYTDSRASRFTKEVLNTLSEPIYANKIVHEAFSATEGKYMQQLLLEYGIPDDHSRICLERISSKTDELERPPYVRISIDSLCDAGKIGCNARNYLAYAGYNYVDQLADLDYDEFSKIKYVGIDDRKNIIRCLRSEGVIFIDERFYYG